ncbi:GNAT family N-acetyltransferase [Methanobacterium sp. MBAC-LM]|uniref:GNAT family N-acetyltransferase n=1 Tax=Methanobacterium sp. MBAC-LM TaxID=3412034 RepID=UPI003C70DCE7
MEDLKIRSTLEEDFVEIADLAENCSPMETERNSIYHIFTKFFRSTSFVAELPSGELGGFLLGFLSQENPEDAYIHLLCVDPKMRGKHIGRKLVEKFTEEAALKECKKIYLITKPVNWNSISFYKKLGFLEDKSQETINILGTNAVKNYNGMGQHMVVFYKSIG